MEMPIKYVYVQVSLVLTRLDFSAHHVWSPN